MSQRGLCNRRIHGSDIFERRLDCIDYRFIESCYFVKGAVSNLDSDPSLPRLGGKCADELAPNDLSGFFRQFL